MPPGVNRLRVTQMNDAENIYVSLNHVLSPNTQKFDVHPHSACKILFEKPPEENNEKENTNVQ